MKKNTQVTHAANLGFEAKLWAAADALRNNMDAPEYKHVVLGLIFLKYISDAFEVKHAELDAQKAQGDTFHNDRHPDLKADHVLANPPFNDNDWRGELLMDNPRWVYGTPPAGNANYAWVQHFIHHLGADIAPSEPRVKEAECIIKETTV